MDTLLQVTDSLPSNLDWYGKKSFLLLHNHLSKSIKQDIKEMSSQLPPLKGHFWLMSSLSTAEIGTFKFIALSKEALLTSAKAVNNHLEISKKDTWLRVLPAFHVGGLSILARSFLQKNPEKPSCKTALSLNLNYSWNVQTYFKELTQSQATLSSLVPTQVHDLVQAKCKAPPHLRVLLVGGASLDPKLFLKAKKLGWPLLPTYGMTECSSQVATAELSSLSLNSKINSNSSLSSNSMNKQDSLPKLKFLDHISIVPIASLASNAPNASNTSLASNASLAPSSEPKPQENSLLNSKSMPTKIQSPSLLTLQAQYYLPTKKVKYMDPKDQEGAWPLPDRIEYQFPYLLKVLGRREDEIKIYGELCNLNPLRKKLYELQESLHIKAEVQIIALPHKRSGHRIHLAIDKNTTKKESQKLQIQFNQKVLSIHQIQSIYKVDSIPKSPLGKVQWKQLQRMCALLNKKEEFKPFLPNTPNNKHNK